MTRLRLPAAARRAQSHGAPPTRRERQAKALRGAPIYYPECKCYDSAVSGEKPWEPRLDCSALVLVTRRMA